MLNREGRAAIARRVQSYLGSLAVWAYLRPKSTLIGLGLITAISVYLAGSLTLDTDLSELLPKSFQSVQAIQVLKQRFGGIGFVAPTTATATTWTAWMSRIQVVALAARTGKSTHPAVTMTRSAELERLIVWYAR